MSGGGSRNGFAWPSGSEAAGRQAWRQLLDRTKAVARLAEAGQPIERIEAQVLGGAAKTGAPFPVRSMTATVVADLFLRLVRAFVQGGCPAWLAGLVLAGVDALDAVLDAEAAAQAEADRRRRGEGD